MTHHRITDGTAQDARLAAALGDHYFDVDERPLAALIAEAAERAKSIRYFNSANRPSGDWHGFFAADEAFVMADIVTNDAARMENEFQHPGQDRGKYLLEFAGRVERWGARLDKAGHDPSQAMREEIRALVASRLNGVAAFAKSIEGLDSLSAEQQEKAQQAFYTLVSVSQYLKPLAEQRLEESLSSGGHDPAMGLFLSFAQVFRNAQDRLNLFTSHHRDFYYDRVLRVTPRAPQPDRTFVVLETEAGRAPVTLAKGTEFTAGRDAVSGVERFYQSRSGIQVTDARVRDLRIVNCRRDADGSGPVNGITAMGVPPTEMAPADAAVGFAVASSALLLREGEREIGVTVTFSLPAEPKDSRLAFLKGGDLGAHSYFEVMGSAFRIDITAADRWYRVSSGAIERPPSGAALGTLRFTLKLGVDAPPVAVWNAAVHGEGYDTTLPVLRFSLNPDAHVYGYSLFQDLEVEEIAIESKVKGATRIVAWNQFGQLDPSKPFNPFGPLPTANSYLIIGSYDCALMNLTRLSIGIEWGDLPGAGGFRKYYAGYPGVYDNSSFEAKLAVLRDGQWRPLAEERQVTAQLFTSSESLDGSLAKQHCIPADGLMRYFKSTERTLPEPLFKFDPNARDGFFRIGLAEPAGAFGHQQYPAELTRVLTTNARRSKWSLSKPLPLPNPPYTPLINRILLDFDATANVRVRGGAPPSPYSDKIYRVHPFGIETVALNRTRAMLPAIDSEETLVIGFSASTGGGGLTLLFQLSDEFTPSVSSPASAETAHRWFYLASGQWLELERERIIGDTTQGFLTSGIVTLDLPGDIDQNNPMMPPGLYWLRVSTPVSLRRRLRTVAAQAVEVERKATASGSAQPLPAGSIKASVNSVPGLVAVRQPIDSRGAPEPETPLAKITRTAERLRHRFRAVTPWDYERLVLDNAPDVFKAKCFSSMSSASGGKRSEPGSVLIVVVPRRKDGDGFEPLLEELRLQEIRDFLVDVASCQAKIEVRNPAYEKILIRCAVQLAGEARRNRVKYLSELNQSLVDYLSPWTPTGPTPRFGWSFRADQIKAFIQGQQYIESVVQFSILHVAHTDSKEQYWLQDTARSAHQESVSHLFPWSLAIPAPEHLLETVPPGAPPPGLPPMAVTGIGMLEIGNTFVVGGGRT